MSDTYDPCATEAWQLTRAEMLRHDPLGYRTVKGNNWTRQRKAEAIEAHRQEIVLAIRAGLPVPDSVRAEAGI